MEKVDPFNVFRQWYKPVHESMKENFNAVALSTCAVSGKVSSRIVLLQSYSNKGFVFFTNYNSRKGKDLKENPAAALLFYWPEMKRQVRIEGYTKRISSKESDTYFNSRKHGHKINALVSKQSLPMEKPDLFWEEAKAARKLYEFSHPPRPSHWGGIRLIPERFEFWEERPDRFHHRIEYIYAGKKWTAQVLQP